MKDLEKRIAELEERLHMRDVFDYVGYECGTLYTVDDGYRLNGEMLEADSACHAIVQYIKTHKKPMRIAVKGWLSEDELIRVIEAYWSEVNECPVINGKYYK